MTEKLFHVGAKALIKNDKGLFLVLEEDVSKHSLPIATYWDLVGGRVKENETVIDALKREIEEEIGVTDISEPKFFSAVVSNHKIKLPDSVIVGLVLMIYEIRIKPEANIVLSDEQSSYRWVKRAEAAKLLSNKYPKDFTNLLLP